MSSSAPSLPQEPEASRPLAEPVANCLHNSEWTFDGNDVVSIKLAPQVTEAPSPEIDKAYGYAERLARAIWQKHWSAVSPDWKPLPDLLGVLTQIDNMTCGLGAPSLGAGTEAAERPALLRSMVCEDCDGKGTEGPEVYQGEFQPPERSPCSSCGGSGRWRCPPLHPFTNDLVDRFAVALKFKLAAAERKYGHSEGWARNDWMDECRLQLIEHIEKGDPRDVAAYCAFLWHHGESTSAIEADIAENADYLADGEQS